MRRCGSPALFIAVAHYYGLQVTENINNNVTFTGIHICRMQGWGGGRKETRMGSSARYEGEVGHRTAGNDGRERGGDAGARKSFYKAFLMFLCLLWCYYCY
jgi:hypothetical protein